MEITGRLTGDATVKTLSGERKVVNFSIAVNDSYRSGGELKKVVTFFECSYWLNTGIAEYLKKGGWVQIYGRLSVNPYVSGDGEVKASLAFHTSEVKLLGGVGGNYPNGKSNSAKSASAGGSSETKPIADEGKGAEKQKAIANKANDTFAGLDDDPPF